MVTGASRGIGLEFVRQCIDKGSNTVIATCRSPSTATELKKLDVCAITQLDVADEASIEQCAKSIRQITPHVDVLINNAGIYGERIKFGTATQENMTEAFITNAVGPLLVVQALYKVGVLGSPSGRPSLVANITSKMGSIDDNTSGGTYGYRTSKSSLNIINKSLSIDLAPQHIRSVLLHPGYVRTDMVNGQGLIDVNESVEGMLSVLENDRELNGEWYAFNGKNIPW